MDFQPLDPSTLAERHAFEMLSRRAYRLWEAAGFPKGEEQKYWDIAEKEKQRPSQPKAGAQ